MTILRIEHAVPDFENWKKAFDRDPVGRQKGGVRRYRVFRPIDDPKYVIVDLEFDNADQAKSFQAALHQLWGRVEGQVMNAPTARILDVTEVKEY